jgi:hypothetical protein
MGQFSREQTRILNLFILYINRLWSYISISMHPLFPIKTQGNHFYTETIYERINMSMHPGYSIQNTRHKHLSETPGVTTAERGARFHPTVGSVTPNGFTTSHPRARPRCLRFSLLLPAQRKSRTKVTLLLLCSELPVFPEFLPVLFRDPYRAYSLPPFPTLPFLPFLQDCVWHEFPRPWSGLRASTDGWFTPIPSLTLKEPPHLPS